MLNDKLVKLYRDRAVKFFHGLNEACWGASVTLRGEVAVSREPVPFAERKQEEFRELREGDVWGGLWDCGWLHVTGEIPEAWRSEEVALRLNLGGEAQIFSDEGLPLSSFTNTSVFESCYRKEIGFLDEATIASGRLDFWMELGANGLFGDELNPDVPEQRCEIGLVQHFKVCQFRREVWNLMLDLEVLMGILNLNAPKGDFVFMHGAFPEGSRRNMQLLSVLNRAIDAYGGNPDNAGKARAILAPELGRPAVDSAMTVCAVGHAHIDTGWLWPVRETVRKCARTFGHQLQLMKRYPDYVFGASQPQHYAFVKEHYPSLFKEIRKRVKDGRWECQGAMWVEADCNLPCGESLVRQFLHGKNFFMREFGVDVKNLWLPDVFGYSAALPQIIRKTGCNAFITQKICWNQFNRFPHHAFTWYGLDNSSVLTFFPPEDTYNSMLVPNQLNYGCDNLTENYLLDESLTLFGIGDGGGGPKEEHVERGLRCRNLEGCPKVKFGRSDDFFDRLRERQDQLPSWHGELYFELHRGTLTTQARNKRNNRKAEQHLLEAEFLASLLPADQWPREILDWLWKKLLLNQFHDIIPGSSIGRVYETTNREYAEMFQKLEELREQVHHLVCRDSEDAITLFNTLPYDYTRLVELPDGWKDYEVICEGEPVPVADGYACVSLKRQGIVVLKRGKKTVEKAVELKEELVLENGLIRYEFDDGGRLKSAYDKELEWEMLSGAGNDLTLYHDEPTSYDAWDIDIFYEKEQVEKARLVKASQVQFTALRQSLELEFIVGQSRLHQTVSLEFNSKRLEFRTKADWHEDGKMLRVAFPTSMVCAEANCEIQYGHIKRPTHRNTSWDMAKFEMCAHRYVDLSESGCGVALLNDCKYGHKVLDGVIDLNLLRSPHWPDPGADRGEHEFTYALLPHTGDLNASKVMTEAAQLNRPCRLMNGEYVGNGWPVRVVEASPNVGVEVMKRGESSDALFLRLADESGKGGSMTLQLEGQASVSETDMMEWNEVRKMEVDRGRVTVNLKPFEIMTLRVE